MEAEPKETTFLLVEDELTDIFFVEREFRKAPRHICLQIAHDGEEAIRYLKGEGAFSDRERHPIPQVILLDLKMPRVNGFEFLEWLRKKSPDELRLIPVLVITASGLEEDIHRAYALGANSYIVKPADWQMFRKLIADLGIYWTEDVETPQVH